MLPARQSLSRAAVVELDSPSLAGAVSLRLLTGAERLAYWHVPEGHKTAWLVARAVVGVDGQPLFDDEDVAWLAECAGGVLLPMASIIRQRNGLTADAPRRLLRALTDDPELRFAYRLAHALGAPDPQVLASHMSSEAFLGWQVFFGLEPWGSAIDDERFGTLAALIGNCHRDKEKRREPFVPKDWFPRLDPDRPLEPESDVDREARQAEFFLHEMKLRAGAAGFDVDLSEVPDIFLSPADRAKQAARRAGAVDAGGGVA